MSRKRKLSIYRDKYDDRSYSDVELEDSKLDKINITYSGIDRFISADSKLSYIKLSNGSTKTLNTARYDFETVDINDFNITHLMFYNGTIAEAGFESINLLREIQFKESNVGYLEIVDTNISTMNIVNSDVEVIKIDEDTTLELQLPNGRMLRIDGNKVILDD